MPKSKESFQFGTVIFKTQQNCNSIPRLFGDYAAKIVEIIMIFNVQCERAAICKCFVLDD